MSTLKVATINLGNRSNRWSERRRLLIDELSTAQPDLISLQDISLPTRQGAWLRDQLNTRSIAAGRTPYELAQQRNSGFIRSFLDGVGILSRLPILAQDAIALGYDGQVALRATVELPTGHTVDYVTVRLAHLPRNLEAMLEQAMTLIGWLSSLGSAPYQILGGVFNAIPNSPAIKQMKQTFRSAYEVANKYEPIATYPTALLTTQDDWIGCVDYLFITANIKVQSAQIFCNRSAREDESLFPSDHVGLLATLEIAAE